MIINTSSISALLGTVTALSLLVVSADAQSNVYVSNLAGSSVSVVNTSTHSVIASVAVPGGPTGLAVTPDGSVVYVACQSAGVVAVINTSSNSVVTSIDVTPGTTQIAINPSGTQVYAVSPAANAISVIETGANRVVGSIGVGTRPGAVAFNRAGTRAFVTNLYSASISVIDTAARSVVATFDAHQGPSGVAVSPDSRRLYVTNQYSGDVTVHDASSGEILQTIGGFAFPNGVAVTPDGNRILVTNGNAGTVSAIDASSSSVIATIGVGSLPTSVAIGEDGARAYVTNEYSFSLSVIDTSANSLVSTIQRVGVYPVAVASRPAGGAVVPPPVSCTFSVSPANASFGPSASAGTINLATAAGCAWTATSSVGWISIVSGSNGSGNGSVTYQVSANGDSTGRVGVLAIGGQRVSISQSGLSCSWTLSSSGTSMAAEGGSGSVNVTALPGCGWSVSSDSGWLQVAGASSGAGSGVVSFSVSANPYRDPRTGRLSVSGQSFVVTQAGSGFPGIRVNCGGPSLVDSLGRTWTADDQRSRSITTAPIAGTGDPAIYQKESWSTGPLVYQFSVPNGAYTVKLKFAEIYVTQSGHRVFDIAINGSVVGPRFDILSQAGPNTAVDQSFGVTVTDGQITIRLIPVTGTPKLSGIEIL